MKLDRYGDSIDPDSCHAKNNLKTCQERVQNGLFSIRRLGSCPLSFSPGRIEVLVRSSSVLKPDSFFHAQHMTTQTTPQATPKSTSNDAVKLPLIQTGLMAMVVCVIVAFVGGLIAQQRGGEMADGLWSMLATIPGVLIPMGILDGRCLRRAPPSGAFLCLRGTMIRALTVLTIGMAIYMIASPDRVVFFLTMLTALMITLIIDVASVLSLIQKHTPGITPAVDAEGIS